MSENQFTQLMVGMYLGFAVLTSMIHNSYFFLIFVIPALFYFSKWAIKRD